MLATTTYVVPALDGPITGPDGMVSLDSPYCREPALVADLPEGRVT